MKYIVDRIEGKFVVCSCEKGEEFIEINKVPSEVKEGDTLVFNGNVYYIDVEDTKKRAEEMENLRKEAEKLVIN